MSVSTAEPRQVAGKILSVHNRHACPKCRRAFDGGVLTFGLSGSDARWYPDAEQAKLHTAGPRYVFPVRDGNVTLDELLAWIDGQREELDQLVEWVEEQREERRMARLEREDNHGFRTDAWSCADCGHPKHRPADRCDRCGDEPCPIGIPHHDYNRGYGYRD